MQKSLQILKNLFFEGGILSPINRWIGLIGIIFSLQDSFGYTPGSISEKYQSSTIESSIWDSWWLATTMTDNWGKQVVRQSLAPSAMVDANGTLFTLNFYNSVSSDGIYFHLRKYTENNYSVSSTKTTVYPWTHFGTDIRSVVPSDTPVVLSMGTRPDLSKKSDDPFYFKSYIHNTYNGCIAQDVNTVASDRVVLFFPIANLRIAASSGDFAGILQYTYNKSTMERANTPGVYSGWNQDNGYSYYHWRPRRNHDSHDYNIELGNYTAWHYGGKVHLNWIATKTAKGFDNTGICWQYNDNWDHWNSADFYNSGNEATGIATYPRYIRFGDYTYGLYSREGGSYTIITRSGVSDGSFSSHQDWHSCFRNKNHLNEAFNYHTTHQYDFCIVKASDGTGIICMLGIRPVQENSTDGTVLSAVKDSRWSSTHLSGGRNHYALMLSSCKIGEDPGPCYEDPQNMIYTTELTTGSACPVTCSCSRTAGEYKTTQLYKNTHKCCVYETNGNQYIIYCYCYPGKTKQLYLGYARCWIDSNYKVQLGPKFEFRETASPWSNSFSNFTSCARIISMDCRNGHLWITWMSADDSSYYYFHIRAKDLVGE